jgi:hypothetical protein
MAVRFYYLPSIRPDQAHWRTEVSGSAAAATAATRYTASVSDEARRRYRPEAGHP